MCECFWGGEGFLGGWLVVGGGRSGAMMAGAGGYGYADGGLREVGEGVSDEGVAVFVEGVDEGLDLGIYQLW